ncbi:DUF3100 domain-containing protein [Proteus mirabilis]
MDKSRSPIKVFFISILAVLFLIFISQYVIGKKEIKIGIAVIPILPMLFAVIIGMFMSAGFTRKKIKVWVNYLQKKKKASAVKW